MITDLRDRVMNEHVDFEMDGLDIADNVGFPVTDMSYRHVEEREGGILTLIFSCTFFVKSFQPPLVMLHYIAKSTVRLDFKVVAPLHITDLRLCRTVGCGTAKRLIYEKRDCKTAMLWDVVCQTCEMKD